MRGHRKRRGDRTGEGDRTLNRGVCGGLGGSFTLFWGVLRVCNWFLMVAIEKSDFPAHHHDFDFDLKYFDIPTYKLRLALTQ